MFARSIIPRDSTKYTANLLGNLFKLDIYIYRIFFRLATFYYTLYLSIFFAIRDTNKKEYERDTSLYHNNFRFNLDRLLIDCTMKITSCSGQKYAAYCYLYRQPASRICGHISPALQHAANA